MRTRDTDILIVPGLGGSGPEHWQSRWEAKLPTARRVEQVDWDRPDAATWVAALRVAMAQGDKPLVIVAHSLGVITAARALETHGGRPVAGAFLVAPPDVAGPAAPPEVAGFRDAPARPLPFSALLVWSRTDPYASPAFAARSAAAWGAESVDAGALGHINVASGHGDWPEGGALLTAFRARVGAKGARPR